ncbi:MAG TPA: Dam family site-specific DNA-(adenine-N6)-methyltransferase [Thermoflexia bacterium]|nr:Dam family site-specific DNA-(adenine-N6)-methyltransferase [Thermoflexia bacterium]
MRNGDHALQPVIKWSGSKRKIAPQIARLFPAARNYFEPFVGGGAMLPFKPCQKAIAGDIIPELIELWKTIQHKPDLTAKAYKSRWLRLQNEGHTAYYDIRSSFNTTRNPHDLLFLSRTCVNGLIRFNQAGNFNNSLHHTRPGIAPTRLRKIIQQWSLAIQNIEFVTADYRDTLQLVTGGDLVFLDPPYQGTKGRYLPLNFSIEEFYSELERLNSIGAKWILTFDGQAGKRAYVKDVPPDIYREHFALFTGNSPFTKLMGLSVDAVVESVYLNFEIPSKLPTQLLYMGKQASRNTTSANMQQGRLFNQVEF